MWLVLFKILFPLPFALGKYLFNVGPSSTYASFTYNKLWSIFKLLTALAAADFKTFSTTTLDALGVNLRIAAASATFFPLTKSTTKRTLRGAIRTVLAIAFASI